MDVSETKHTTTRITGNLFHIEIRIAHYLNEPRVRVTMRGRTVSVLNVVGRTYPQTLYLTSDELAVILLKYVGQDVETLLTKKE
jgi:hypothetical protein